MQFLLALTLLGSAVPALAGPPFFTDDPKTLKQLQFEAYLYSTYLQFSGGSTGAAPLLAVNFGLTPNVEFHVAAPFSYKDPNNGKPSNSGYGDTTFGVKYRFLQESHEAPMAAFYPLIVLPTGTPSRGLGNGNAQFSFPLWVQKDFGTRWTVNSGIAYWVIPGHGNEDYWFTGVEVQNHLSKLWTVGGELYHTTPRSAGGRVRTGYNLGAVYGFKGGHQLKFSIGRTFQGEKTTTAYLAFVWTFQDHKK